MGSHTLSAIGGAQVATSFHFAMDGKFGVAAAAFVIAVLFAVLSAAQQQRGVL